MASLQKTAASCEVDEEEYEDYEEMEVEEDVEGEDYEEFFEEEEEEMEQNEEEEEVEKKEEKEIKLNKEEEAEEIEQNEEEEEEKIEQHEEEEEEMEEEEEIEQNEEEEKETEQNEREEGGDKKAVEFLKVQEEEHVQDPVRKEVKSANFEGPSESEGNALPLRMVFPPFLQSVSDLEKLHSTLAKFFYEWNSYNRYLDSINAAIDAHAPSQHDVRSTEQKKDDRSEEEKGDENIEQEKEKGKLGWVKICCEQMRMKGLLKYIEFNLSNVDRLRHKVPEALRRLSDPEKFVFEAIGKFYMKGRRAYSNNIPLIKARTVSVLLLEFFVLSGRPTVAYTSVKQEAGRAALLWLKRLVKEDIKKASVVDPIGLILFLACFGIPKEFGSKDLSLLLLKSKLMDKKIDVFLRSIILVERIPGVIKDLIREEMYFEAAELSCRFGLTDTFPPVPLLSSFAAKALKTGAFERLESPSPKLMIAADFRELESLRSVVNLLKKHNFDTSGITSMDITNRIHKLERFVNKDEKELKSLFLKRKAEHLHRISFPSNESVPSTSEASQIAPSHMIQKKSEQGLPSQPLFPDSKVENDTHSVADTVIQQEAPLAKSNRSSNTSPAGAKFGLY